MNCTWRQADFDKAMNRPLTAKERRVVDLENRKGNRELLEKITRERDVLRCITDYLTVEGIWWMRCNAGEVDCSDSWNPMRPRHQRIRLAPAGTADLLAIVPTLRQVCWNPSRSKGFTVDSLFAIPLWIEVKRPSSKARRSPEQIAFAERMHSIGCLHIWAQDVEDVMAVVPPKIRKYELPLSSMT